MSEKKMDFEQAYEDLKETVEKLENPDQKIEDSIELYERACKLVLYCQRILNDTKLRITDINERISAMKAEDGEDMP